MELIVLLALVAGGLAIRRQGQRLRALEQDLASLRMRLAGGAPAALAADGPAELPVDETADEPAGPVEAGEPAAAGRSQEEGPWAQAAAMSAADTPDRIEHVLKSALVGRTRAEVVPILTEMGARGAYAYDLMDTGLAAGAEVGNGYRAGDQVLTVNFGLARGGIQPDRRLRIYLAYGDEWRAADENDRISGVREIEYYAK